jgi:outer membrane protein assembly factor BamB
LKLLWHAEFEPGGPLATQVLSAPVVADGLVVAVATEEVISWDLVTGSRVWSVPRTRGPVSQPAVALVGDRPVLLYTEGGAGDPLEPRATGPTGSGSTPSPSPQDQPAGPADSRLVAIDIGTREPLWEPIELTETSRSGVTVDGDRAYVVDVQGRVFAIDLAAGTVAWSRSVKRAVDGPPAVAEGVVVVTGRGSTEVPGASVVALGAADGSVRWRRNVDAPGIVFPSAPSIADGLAIATLTDFSLRAWDLATGDPRWSVSVGYPPRFPPIPLDSGVAIEEDAIFVGDQIGSVYRFDAVSGDRVWDFAVNEAITFGAPVLSGGSLLIGTDDGSVHALDPETGERLWRHEQSGQIRSLTPAGSVVVAVRTGSGSGLDAYGPDPDGRLLREASPTTPDYLRMLGSFALAAVPLAGIALVAGRLLVARVGPAFEEPDSDEQDGEEP